MSIKDQIDQLDDQIQELNNKRSILAKQLMQEQQEKLKVLVGVCFCHKGKFYKIVDVPQHEMSYNFNYSFNPYQLPVVVLAGNDLVEDTIFSHAVLYDDPLKRLQAEYGFADQKEEIAKFDLALNDFVNRLRAI